MIPAFTGSTRTRQINLGGATSTVSHDALLDALRVQREHRRNERRRLDAAQRIQAWWRGKSEGRRVKDLINQEFDTRSTPSVQWTRLLVVGWSGGAADARRLAKWSQAMAQNPEVLLGPFQTPESNSWLVLLRQVALLLVRDVSLNPQSIYATNHLAVLNILLSSRNPTSTNILEYLLRRNLYALLSRAILLIPLDDKDSCTTLPLITTLIVSPFTIVSQNSSLYSSTLLNLLQHLFAIPLLPNRFPLPSLTLLASRIPFDNLAQVRPQELKNMLSLGSPEQRVARPLNLLANLAQFVPIRLVKFAAPSVWGYMDLITSIAGLIPSSVLDPPSAKSENRQNETAESDEEDDDHPMIQEPPTAPNILARPDPRTLKRLGILISPAHASTLLKSTTKEPASQLIFFRFLLAFVALWPSKKGQLLSSVAFSNAGPRLFKDIWRNSVRGSPLGRNERTGTDDLKDPSLQAVWPALMCLIESYTYALNTMGDDEFFSVGKKPDSPRNPFSLDELGSLSKRMMNIVFPLYWNEDQINLKTESPPGLDMTWEGVREQITQCLKAIHARDSRRKFTSEHHWLMTSQIDIKSFCEAAVFEEFNLDKDASRSLSRRQLAFISPRLGILNNIPFAIPFAVRVQIFRSFIGNDMQLHHQANPVGYHCTVRRNQLSKDGYDALNPLGPKLKSRIQITFIDGFGEEERGIDGGGVFKEFLTSLSKEAFDTDRGLWLATKQQELYPNPHSYAKEAHQLSWYQFIGRILGKALYEGILVDVNFATFFLAKWLGRQSFLDDLASLDPELYKGLLFLKHYQGNVEDLALNFSITNEELGVTKTINLIPDGVNVPVTASNKIRYIFLVSHYRLNSQIKKQSKAFFDGLSDLIDPKWLRMFNQQELQILIGGTEEPVNIEDLRANTVYGGAFHDDHDTIKAFWKVLKSFDQAQRCLFLRFFSSCSRAPLLGFKELYPKFSVRDAGSDQSRLPTASTCVNLLKLPMYTNEITLRQKLLQAITSGAGFDLS